MAAAYLLSQSGQSLLLGVRVDVCTDEECHEVEERHPHVFRQELLGECEGDGGRDPADLHDWHEACTDGGADLVESPCTGNDGHGGKVHCVLDGRYLYDNQLFGRVR